MKMKLLGTVLLTACLALPAMVMAQNGDAQYMTEKQNDVRFRTGFEFEKKFSRKLALSWNEEFRLKNTFTRVDRIYSELALAYKPVKWFRVSAGYTFITRYKKKGLKSNPDKHWDLRHRASADVSFIYKTHSNWRFSLRERVLATFRTDEFNKDEKSNPDLGLRSRLKAEYKFRHIPILPYAYVELCNTLNAPVLADGNYIDKVRSSLGVEWRLNKRSSFDFFYRFDYGYDRDINLFSGSTELESIVYKKDYNHIIGIFYKYKF